MSKSTIPSPGSSWAHWSTSKKADLQSMVDAINSNNDNYLVRSIRTRFTVAEVNAGATILAASAGQKYRMVDCTIAAQGGSAATGTAVIIVGTQTSAASLVSFATAQLTDDCFLRPGITGTTILANGASFIANDANTAITIAKTGSNFATVTHFDVCFSYVTETA